MDLTEKQDRKEEQRERERERERERVAIRRPGERQGASVKRDSWRSPKTHSGLRRAGDGQSLRTRLLESVATVHGDRRPLASIIHSFSQRILSSHSVSVPGVSTDNACFQPRGGGSTIVIPSFGGWTGP